MEKKAEPLSSPPVAACIDIGGTKALLGIVTQEGSILACEKMLITPQCEPADLVKDLARRMKGLAEKGNIDWGRFCGVGYSTAGMMDVRRGIIFASPNQGSWRDIPFQDLLRQTFRLPAWIEMDANAAALGEAWLGAGKDADPLIYLVIGTGIGGGILMNGQIVRGWRGTAGEVGHMVIDPNGPACNCGGSGCLESLASGPAIALRAQKSIQNGSQSCMKELAGAGHLTAEIVFQAARLGDKSAVRIVEETIEYLSIGLTNLIHLLNPRAIVIGGGVGLGGADLLLGPLREAVNHRVGPWVDMSQTTISASILENHAGLLGAAWLVWNLMDREKTE